MLRLPRSETLAETRLSHARIGIAWFFDILIEELAYGRGGTQTLRTRPVERRSNGIRFRC